MNVFDFAILVIVGGLAVLGFWRGFIKEVLETVGVAVSAYLAFLLFPSLRSAIGLGESASWYNKAAVFLLIFVVLMVVFSILGALARKFVRSINLGMYDHLLGLVLGALKGGILIAVLATLAGFVGPPLDAAVRGSRLAQANMMAFDMIAMFLPDYIQKSRNAVMQGALVTTRTLGGNDHRLDLTSLSAALHDADILRYLRLDSVVSPHLIKLDSILSVRKSFSGVVLSTASLERSGSIDYAIAETSLIVPWYVGSMSSDTLDPADLAAGDSVQFELYFSSLLGRICAVNIEPAGPAADTLPEDQ